jgi:hypothetical protein
MDTDKHRLKTREERKEKEKREKRKEVVTASGSLRKTQARGASGLARRRGEPQMETDSRTSEKEKRNEKRDVGVGPTRCQGGYPPCSVGMWECGGRRQPSAIGDQGLAWAPPAARAATHPVQEGLCECGGWMGGALRRDALPGNAPRAAAGPGQALRLRSGQALRLHSGQALRLHSGQAGQAGRAVSYGRVKGRLLAGSGASSRERLET